MATFKEISKKNVQIKDLIVGKQYVFGDYSDRLGFIPTCCNGNTCRVIVAKVGRKYVNVQLQNGTIDKGYDGEGFFEIEDAKALYFKSLKERQQNGYPQTDAEIECLVKAL